MHRDQFRDAEQFTNHLVERDRARAILLEHLDKDLVRRGLVVDDLRAVSAAYSAGSPVDEIDARVRGLCALAPQMLDARLGLEHDVPLSALAVLCDVDSDLAEGLRTVMDLPAAPGNLVVRSRVVDLFLGDESVWHPDPSSDYWELDRRSGAVDRQLWAIAEAAHVGDAAASELLVTFVKQQWYRGMRGASWWNSHELNVFHGYWCFEAAALAKMFALDDSALQGHKYYPWDLVHRSG